MLHTKGNEIGISFIISVFFCTHQPSIFSKFLKDDQTEFEKNIYNPSCLLRRKQRVAKQNVATVMNQHRNTL